MRRALSLAAVVALSATRTACRGGSGDDSPSSSTPAPSTSSTTSTEASPSPAGSSSSSASSDTTSPTSPASFDAGSTSAAPSTSPSTSSGGSSSEEGDTTAGRLPITAEDAVLVPETELKQGATRIAPPADSGVLRFLVACEPKGAVTVEAGDGTMAQKVDCAEVSHQITLMDAHPGTLARVTVPQGTKASYAILGGTGQPLLTHAEKGTMISALSGQFTPDGDSIMQMSGDEGTSAHFAAECSGDGAITISLIDSEGAPVTKGKGTRTKVPCNLGRHDVTLTAPDGVFGYTVETPHSEGNFEVALLKAR